MNVPQRWRSESRVFDELVPGRCSSLGEEWSEEGGHHYVARMPVETSTLSGVRAAAERLSAKVLTAPDGATIHLAGAGWRATARVVDGDELEIDVALDGPSRAKELAGSIPALAPFVELAQERGVSLRTAARIERVGAGISARLVLSKPGFREFLAYDFGPWLVKHGFERRAAGGTTSWAFGGVPVALVPSDASPDELRVEVDGAPEVKAPPADAVFLRGICLWALWNRGQSERSFQSAGEGERKRIEAACRSLLEWLERDRVAEALSPVEHQLLVLPVGRWTKRQMLGVGWSFEAIGTIAWALGRVDVLPAYDTQFSEDTVADVFPFLEAVEPRAEEAELRSAEMIEAARATAHTWNRRATVIEPFFARMLGKMRADSRLESADRARIRECIGEDVLLFGRPYSECTLAEFSSARSIASERLGALTWLCTGGAWDDRIAAARG